MTKHLFDLTGNSPCCFSLDLSINRCGKNKSKWVIPKKVAHHCIRFKNQIPCTYGFPEFEQDFD